MAGKNAEGYPDPTASIAIGLVTKKEKEKEKMKDTANPEEIWMIQSAQGDVPALVLADDGQTAVYIKLRKTSITCQDIDVTYRGKMYANPMMIQYTQSEPLYAIPVEEYPEQVAMREDAFISEMNDLKANIHSLEVALARCEGERDVYKELFTNNH